MNANEIRPEKEYKSIMFIIWGIVLAIIGTALLVLLIFIPKTEGKIAVSVIIAIFTIIMSCVAIWISRYFKSIVFSVDDDAVRMSLGVVWKRQVTVPYRKITNVDVVRGPLERLYGLGTLHIQTAGAGGADGARAEVVMSGLKDLDGPKDMIMARVSGYSPQTNPIERTVSETPQAADGDTLGLILEELRGIRKALDK